MPDAGSIRFLGQEIAGRPVHAICCLGMGRTFQNLRLFADLSVLDNVMLGRHSRMTQRLLRLAARPARRAAGGAAGPRARARRSSTSSGLSKLADGPAGSLPYGLQRRVELARALATEPQAAAARRAGGGPQPAGDGRARPAAGAHRQVRRQHPAWSSTTWTS